MAQGKLAEALEAYQRRHETTSSLAARHPNNAEWQRDLVMSHSKLADLAEQRGEPDEAKGHWRKALEIAKALDAAGRLAPTDAYFIETIEARLAAIAGDAAASR